MLTQGEKLFSEIEKLKRITEELCLEDMVNFVTHQQQTFNRNVETEREKLSSPLRQGMYLLGISASQKEPEVRKPIDDGKFEQLTKILNAIFNNYALAYFPEKSEVDRGLDEKWHRHRQIAMPAFIHHFSTGFKASTDQVKSWINIYFDGYEEKIESKFGINHHELLLAGDFFEQNIVDNFENLKEQFKKADSYRLQFLKDIEEGKDASEAISEVRNNTEAADAFKKLLEDMNEVYSVKKEDIINKLGGKVSQSLFTHFTTTRGESDEVTYITDSNPVINKPLVTADGEKFFFVVNNSFYQAIIEQIEKELEQGKAGVKFLRNRDKRLEKQAVKQFERLFDDNVQVFEGLYETNTKHNEHDLVIRNGRQLYIIEAKASPPRVPLRDPSKAFNKIKDHFKSKSGIQKAYEQAERLRSNIINNGSQSLYNDDKKIVTTLKSDDFDEIYTICVTRDDFGVLATSLTLLLDKDEKSPYPWVISIADLEFLIDGFKHLEYGIEKFNLYLTQRKSLHGKVLGMDELEYAGAFLKYDGLDCFINAEADLIPLEISESDIFDQIYLAEKEGRKYELKIQEPHMFRLDRDKLFAQNKKKKHAQQKRKKKRTRKQASKARKRNRGK